MSRYCRQCAASLEPDIPQCRICRSRRLIAHPELDRLAIAHVDCDAFFAAVEKRDHPELADKPVIIGGGQRGVVATACYVARTYGVRSAMPMFKALKACPHAVVIRGNMEKYVREGRRIRELMESFTPLVQPLSIDEAFMDLTGTERIHGCSPAKSLIQLQARIEREVGITVSVGLSFNKLLAKIASDQDKPRGYFVLGRAEARDFLADQPVSLLPGVGPKFAQTLVRAGYRTLGTLQTADDAVLIRQFGEEGLSLAARARGEDSRPVKVERDRKSVSSERTFDKDIHDRGELERVIWTVCERTAERAKQAGVCGHTITLKLKDSQFRSLTRSSTVVRATQLSDDLFAAAIPLLGKVTSKGPWRLVGVGLSDLEPAYEDTLDLGDPDHLRRAKAERARDALKERFGKDTVIKGRSLPKA